MTKGTYSKGKRNHKSHSLCPRCGRKAFHKKKKSCAACGYPNPKTRKYNWCTKASRRKKTGTGRMRYLRRALKRRSNRRRFEALPALLRKAILTAAQVTEKRMPPRRDIHKQYKKLKIKIAERRQKREKFIESLQEEVAKRVAQKS